MTRDGSISVMGPFSFLFPLLFFFSFFFWYSDRTIPSRRHHPYPLPLSVSPLIHPIWSCMGEIYWRLGGLSLQRSLSLLSARLCLSSGRRDLLQSWMFSGHQVWRLLLVRDSIDYLTLRVDLLKLFFLKSPHHTRIAWHFLPWQIRFDFLVVCLAGIKASNLLLFRTSIVVVALVIF